MTDTGAGTNECFCTGPKNGQPLCPCRMKFVTIRDGRYVLPEQDLGPCLIPEEKRHQDALKMILAHADKLPKPQGTFK